MEMFGKYIETPPSIKDLLKINGARFNQDNGKTIMVLNELSSTSSAYMLGWYNSYQDIDPCAKDGVFLPTWSGTSFDDFKKIINGDIEECANGIKKGKVWQRSQIVESQEIIDELKGKIKNRELKPVIDYSIPIYDAFCNPKDNQSNCYLLRGNVYFVQEVNKNYDSIQIDDGREFKPGDFVAVSITPSDFYLQADGKGKIVGCSNDCCSGVPHVCNIDFFKAYFRSFIQLQEEMNRLCQQGKVKIDLKTRLRCVNPISENPNYSTTQQTGNGCIQTQGIQTPNGR